MLLDISMIIYIFDYLMNMLLVQKTHFGVKKKKGRDAVLGK